jgi:rhomboid family GlyGly-CTERM serine protease
MGSSPNKESVTVRWPMVTAALVAISICVWVVPRLPATFIFDRVAILHGEIWRLFTGQFVHVSLSHLVCDASVVAGAGAALERSGPLRYVVLCLIAPLLIGVGVVVFEPDVGFFSGLSGLAMCFGTGLAMQLITSGRRSRWLGCLIFAAVVLKLVAEYGNDVAFLDLGTGVVRSRVAHSIGAIVGFGWIVGRRGRLKGARRKVESRCLVSYK